MDGKNNTEWKCSGLYPPMKNPLTVTDCFGLLSNKMLPNLNCQHGWKNNNNTKQNKIIKLKIRYNA